MFFLVKCICSFADIVFSSMRSQSLLSLIACLCSRKTSIQQIVLVSVTFMLDLFLRYCVLGGLWAFVVFLVVVWWVWVCFVLLAVVLVWICFVFFFFSVLKSSIVGCKFLGILVHIL